MFVFLHSYFANFESKINILAQEGKLFEAFINLNLFSVLVGYSGPTIICFVILFYNIHKIHILCLIKSVE